MPLPSPNRSLPPSLRDGRLGSSSLLSTGPAEHFYSNEEIELIHDIVVAAEHELPQLPERDRLPTNALFRAVEKIYTDLGLDPQNVEPQISRLIFKIGGQRGGASLLDKFRAVLGKMGIELEFHATLDGEPVDHDDDVDDDNNDDDDVDAVDEQHERTGSRTAGTMASDDQIATLDPAAGEHGRRRSSDTSIDSDGSYAEHTQSPQLHPRFNALSRLQDARDIAVPTVEADGISEQWPALDSIALPDQHGPRPLQNDSQASVSMEEASLPFPETQRHEGAFPGHIPIYQDLPLRLRGQQSEQSDSHNDLERSPSTIPDTIADTEQGFVSQQSFVESENVFRGASDTTAQSQDLDLETPDQRHAEEQLEKRLKGYREQLLPFLYLRAWYDEAQSAEEDRVIAESHADRIDLECVVPEVLEIWDDNAHAQAQERIDAELEAQKKQQEAEHEIDRRERKASRAYELHLCDKAFNHWAICADEEAQRTALARRHLLRKKFFTAWRQYHARQEAKVASFITSNAFQLWSEAVEYLDEGAHLAVQKYQGDVVVSTFRNWIGACHARVAEEMARRSMVQTTFIVWNRETESRASLDSCMSRFQSDYASRILCDWGHLAETNHDHMASGLQELQLVQCKNDMTDWQAYALLCERLRGFTAAQEEQLQVDALQIWSERATTATNLSEQAPRLFVDEYLDTWACESEVVRLQQKHDEELATETMYEWYLTEKLAFFERYSAEKAVKDALDDWTALSDSSQDTHDAAWRLAEAMDRDNTVPSILTAWAEETEQMVRHEEYSDAVMTHHTAGDSLEFWSDGLAAMDDWPDWADRGAYFCAVTDALSWWPQAAKKSHEERIVQAYHGFRRRFKTEIVSDCLLNWRAAAEDAEVAGWEAEQIRISRDEEAAIDTFEFWDVYAENQATCNEIAIEADAEAQLTKWAAVAEAQAEMEMDAIDYDSGQTLTKCWENWELSALQSRGRQYPIAEIQEKNNKKLCRQVLATWAQTAFPDVVSEESTLPFRRSARSSSAASRLFSTPAPQSSMTSFTSDLRATGRSAAPVQQLSRISEEEALKRSSPDGFTSPPARVGRDSYWHEQRHSHHEPPIDPGGFSAPVRGLASYNQFPPRARTSPLRQDDYVSARYEPPYAPTASSLSRSERQLPPMSEFDEDFRTDDGTTGPVLMSTPTRWTGAARPLSHSQRPSTTPAAPVPTPYQRATREGDGNTFAAARQSATSRRQTPRVAFANFRGDRNDMIE